MEDPFHAATLGQAIARIAESSGPAQVQTCLVRCIGALGVEHAFFATLTDDGPGAATCRLMLACDPRPFRRSPDDWSSAAHPWLAYAALHAEPIDANDPWLTGEGRVADSATLWGPDFASAYLVPAHAGPGHSSFGLLALGSRHTQQFRGAGLPLLRQGARVLAAELHEWWLKRERQEFLAGLRISPFELELLRHARRGAGSKQMAQAMQSTVGAVDSRFQRLNTRLGVANRRAATRLAVSCRLLPF